LVLRPNKKCRPIQKTLAKNCGPPRKMAAYKEKLRPN
jgi:hypothetical protein